MLLPEALVFLGCAGFSARFHLLQVVLPEFSNALLPFQGGTFGRRVLALSDASELALGELASFVRGERAVRAKDDPFRHSSAAPGSRTILHHVGLVAGGCYLRSEAGKRVVPDEKVFRAGLERVYGALGDSLRGHPLVPSREENKHRISTPRETRR